MRDTLWLADWHADPMSKDDANRLSEELIRRRDKVANRHRCFTLRLLGIVADWWLDKSAPVDLDRAFIDSTSKRQLAMSHLLVGQLLMSKKLSGAMTHLEKGLDYADGLLKPDDYFRVYNRHTELAILPLSEQGQPGQPLSVLLNEAAVIKQLERSHPGLSRENWPSGYSIP